MKAVFFLVRLSLIIGIPLVIGYCTYQFVYTKFFEAVDPNSATPIVVEVPPGSSFKELCVTLEKNSLIKHWWVLDVISRLRGESTRIQPGEYLLSQTMTPLEILKIIASGKLHKRPFVLEEGSDVLSVIAAFQDAGLADEEAVREKLVSGELIVRAGIRGDTILGYMAPGEYEFSKSETIERMFWELLDRASTWWTAEWLEQSDKLRMSRHEIITLASLIEGVGAPKEHLRNISSVYHNRLDSVMLLKSEAALRTILTKKNGELTEEDQTFQSPYNSFINYGLPPGPINNPSKEAIIAALYPENTNYFDFKKNGTQYEFIEQADVEPLALPEEAETVNSDSSELETP